MLSVVIQVLNVCDLHFMYQ